MAGRGAFGSCHWPFQRDVAGAYRERASRPVFAATHPSDVVVLENTVLPGTRGNVQQVEAKYELLKRGEYTLDLQDARGADATSVGVE